MLILIVCLWRRGGFVHFKRRDNGLITLWKNTICCRLCLLSARLTPPEPIAFDNHSHFLLTETNGTRSVESQRGDSKVPSWKHGSLIVCSLMYSFCLIERGRDGDLRAQSKECSEYLKPASLFLPWPIHSQLVGHVRLWLVSPLANFLKLRSMSKWKNQQQLSVSLSYFCPNEDKTLNEAVVFRKCWINDLPTLWTPHFHLWPCWKA